MEWFYRAEIFEDQVGNANVHCDIIGNFRIRRQSPFKGDVGSPKQQQSESKWECNIQRLSVGEGIENRESVMLKTEEGQKK